MATQRQRNMLLHTLLTVIFFHLEHREREKRERKEEDTFTELRKRRPNGNRLESTKRSSLHYYSSKAKEAASERGFDVNLCIANERSRLDFPFFWGGFVLTFLVVVVGQKKTKKSVGDI
jgi:hypothetical protein